MTGLSEGPPQAEVMALIGLLSEGRLLDAVRQGEALAARHPGSPILCNMLGAIHMDLKQHEAAGLWFGKALAIQPGAPDTHFNLGVAMQELARDADAIASYEQALRLQPGHALACHNLGSVLARLGQGEAAITRYRQALQIKPDYVEAHHNLGLALQRVGQHQEAAASFVNTLRLKPDHADAFCNLGICLQALGRREEAIGAFSRALAIRPDHGEALGRRTHQQAHVCDWDALATATDAIARHGTAEGVPPFGMLAIEDAPARHRQRAEHYGALLFGGTGEARPFARPAAPPERLRIGYFSADFHNHATMYLMARLFERHDRQRFAIHAYSYGPDADDAMRQRLRGNVDLFRDVRALGDRAVADLARADGIDIAVDLKGYTQDARLGILAWRPAPVQISYLGYPGTLGVPFIDYIVADRTVIPDEQRRHYAEKILFLPGSYQVNDDQRAISDHPVDRAGEGLPADVFVFCCFNNSYKISPVEFDIWMRLLRQVDGSVLWLLEANPWVQRNLRKEAARRGVAEDRLVFAPKRPHADHLARQRLADLFLDSFIYNAHTTASDALWGGLPVLTKLGDGFAARVAGSLLNAIGLPELITRSADEYERLALRLATEPALLAGIRAKLAAVRRGSALFDTPAFVHALEDGYQQAWHRWFAGKEPADIAIEARTGR